MKKIFIIFLSMIVLSLSLVLPSFAVMTDSFGSYTNLFDPSDVVQARFYTDLDNYQNNNFYSVSLEPDTDYTFISTSGSRNFFVGENVSYNGYSSVFSFDSWNKFPNSSTLIGSGTPLSIFSLPDIELGKTYYLVGTGTNISSSYFQVLFQLGTSYTNREIFYADFIWGGSANLVIPFTVTQDMYNSYGYNFTLQLITTGGESEFKFIMVTEEEYVNSYLPYYFDPVYNDELTYVYNFRTPSSITSNTQILVGINDVLSGSTSNKFSYNQSSQNEFYLVKGSLTPNQIADVLQQDRYNQGFTQGYKEGEFDGLNSTKFMNSTLLTAISAPFVIVSSALNFDLFGINFYYILQVIFTLLLVAFVVTQLKGRE